MLPEPADIPRPKPEDKDYMKLWHKYLQSAINGYKLGRERDAWRSAFYAVAAVLFALMFTLLVLLGSRFINI